MGKDPDYESIARALFESYENIYDINIEDNSYTSFHESENYKKLKLEREGDDFFREAGTKIKEVIAPCDRDYVLKMIDKERMLEGLKGGRYYTFIYRILRDGKEVYHQIRAVLKEIEGTKHILMGIKDIDEMIHQEKAHRNEISALNQKQDNHMKAVLASAAAYIEVNLTKDIVLEKSDDLAVSEKKFIKKLPSTNKIPEYTRFHEWVCKNLIIENKEKYKETFDRDSLIRVFSRGERRATSFFSCYTKEKGVLPCREVAFLYKEEETENIMAFLVIYDLTEDQKKEREVARLEEELRLSRTHNFTSQMGPHFLYNALGSIQEIILFDPEYASDLLGDFTTHLRSCIRTMVNDKPLPFSLELDNVKAYINIEKMRFGDKLKVHYDIRTEDFSILPLTIQPIVENAIRHGIYEKGLGGGDVYIRTFDRYNEWRIEIEDNGVGFNVDWYYQKERAGEGNHAGLRNVEFRLTNMMNAMMEIDSRVGKGTIVTIHLPKEI